MDILLSPEKLRLQNLADIGIGEFFYSANRGGSHSSLRLKIRPLKDNSDRNEYIELEGGEIPFLCVGEAKELGHLTLPLGLRWRLRLVKDNLIVNRVYETGSILATSIGPYIVADAGNFVPGMFRFVSLTDFSTPQKPPEGELMIFHRWQILVEEAPGREIVLFEHIPQKKPN
jgi:hypothetical protein